MAKQDELDAELDEALKELEEVRDLDTDNELDPDDALSQFDDEDDATQSVPEEEEEIEVDNIEEFDDIDEDVEGLDDEPAKKKGMLDYIIYGALGFLGLVAVGFVAFLYLANQPQQAQPSDFVEPAPVEQVQEQPVEPEPAPEDTAWEEAEANPVPEANMEQMPVLDAIPELEQLPESPEMASVDAERLVALEATVADLTGRLNLAEAKLDKFASVLIEAGSKITKLEKQVAGFEQAEAEKAVKQSAVKKAVAAPVKKAESKPAVSTSAGINKLSSKTLSQYEIQSMVNNKVWLKYKGERHVLGIGDKVPGGGRIVAINLGDKTVNTTQGLIK